MPNPPGYTPFGDYPNKSVVKTKTKVATGLTTQLVISLAILGVTAGFAAAVLPVSKTVTPAQTKPAPTAFTITTPSPLPSGFTQVAYDFTLAASGGTSPYHWEFGAARGGVPDVLQLDPQTGRLYFAYGVTPRDDPYHFSVVVQDAHGTQASRDYDFVIKDSTHFHINSINPLPPAVVGVPYRYDFSATTSGYSPPFTWSLVGSELPPAGWLTNSNQTLIAQSPQATQVGTYRFTMRVTSGGGQMDTETFYLSVLPAGSLSIITPSPLPSGDTQVAYDFTLTASGGTSPYHWEFGGARAGVPSQLQLNPETGRLYFQTLPASDGQYHFSVVVQDSRGTQAHRDYDLVVKDAEHFHINSINPLPAAVVGVPYRYDFDVKTTNWLPPFTWTKLSGDLPAGWLTNSNQTLIAQSPQAAQVGTYRFTMKVTSGSGQMDSETFYLNVRPSGSFTITTPSPLPSAVATEQYDFTLTATGGVTPYHWNFIYQTNGTPPININPSTGHFYAPALPMPSGQYHFIVVAEDANGTQVYRDYDLVVSSLLYQLNVSVIGDGMVVSWPQGIACGGTTCSAHYVPGTLVTLTATPRPGAAFKSWMGACSGTSPICDVKMNAAQSVTAVFTATSGIGTSY